MLLLSVLAASLLGAPLADRGNLSGEVAIEAGTNAIAVYVDTDRDASIDQRFLLSFERHDRAAAMKFEREIDSKDPVIQEAIPPRRYFDSATVEFAPGYVRVAGGGEAFEFCVEGNVPAEWNPAGARVWRWTGYGLSRTAFESGIAIKRTGRDRSITAEWCDASTDCDGGDTDGGGGQTTGGSGTSLCDSGGVGSTSCSQKTDGSASCSVTCGAGFYACCKDTRPPSCKCIRG